MFRRVLNSVLLLAGAAAILYWAWRPLPIDLRFIVSLEVVLLVGIGLNLMSVLRRNLTLRWWLRILALMVTVLGLAAVIALGFFIANDVRSTSPRNMELRTTAELSLQVAWRLGSALAYVAVSLLLLPPNPARTKLSGNAEDRE